MEAPLVQYHPASHGFDTHGHLPRFHDQYSSMSDYNKSSYSPSYLGKSQDLDYRNTRLPPSPPMEKSHKISLPPISTLFGYSRDLEPSFPDRRSQSQFASERRQHTYNDDRARLTQPPTPPGRSYQSEFGSSAYSKVETSPRQVLTQHSQRQRGPSVSSGESKRLSLQSRASYSSSTRSNYTSSPELGSTQPRYLPNSGMSQQRPLPSEYSPRLPISRSPQSSAQASLPTPSSASTNPTDRTWHHTHFNPATSLGAQRIERHSQSLSQTTISTSSISSLAHRDSLPQAVTPVAPERYICPSCAKAFSRPSSLRIHVHSHTGEKPFRCPHEGCGKAFSVRSNMKRHQRGCHITGGGAMVPAGRMDIEED